MVKRFFRVQGKGVSFEEMQQQCSLDGASEEERHEGLAVCLSASGHDGGGRFGGAWDAMNPDDELVVLEGEIVAKLYDGYTIRPTREVARFTIEEWERMLADGSAQQWESWE